MTASFWRTWCVCISQGVSWRISAQWSAMQRAPWPNKFCKCQIPSPAYFFPSLFPSFHCSFLFSSLLSSFFFFPYSLFLPFPSPSSSFFWFYCPGSDIKYWIHMIHIYVVNFLILFSTSGEKAFHISPLSVKCKNYILKYYLLPLRTSKDEIISKIKWIANLTFEHLKRDKACYPKGKRQLWTLKYSFYSNIFFSSKGEPLLEQWWL